MENQVAVYDRDQGALADDTLIAIARQAEARIDAVVKIKQLALKVTNGGDWTDQGGKPYLMVSGAEKIANLFNVSWSFLTPEPIYEETADGHYTFTYQGRFTMGSRSIEVEGSRSSKDKFFTQNDYINNEKVAKAVGDRDNKRDVKMAALTNLLGNGITRLLGIRNLSWEDLAEFAKITKDMCGKVDYKTKNADKPPIQAPQKKAEAPGSSSAAITIKEVIEQTKTQAGAAMKNPLYHIHSEEGGDYKTFDKKLAELATASIGKPADVTFEKTQYGTDLKTMVVLADRDPGAEG